MGSGFIVGAFLFRIGGDNNSNSDQNLQPIRIADTISNANQSQSSSTGVLKRGGGDTQIKCDVILNPFFLALFRQWNRPVFTVRTVDY
jgi:hypothetical protein